MVVYDYDEPRKGQTIEDAQKEKAEKYRKEYEKYKREEMEPAIEKMYADLRAKFAPKEQFYRRGGKKRSTRKNIKSKKVKKSKKVNKYKKVNKTMKYKRNNRR